MAVGVHVAYRTPLNQFTFVFSLLMGFEQVVASGVLDRFPRLRVSFLEASCNWVPFMMERVEEKANPERKRFAPTRPLDTVIDRHEQGGYRSELSPSEYIQRGNLWFGFEVEDPLLPYCLEHFGEDCWVYGSDIPHGDRLKDAAKVLQKRATSPRRPSASCCETTWPATTTCPFRRDGAAAGTGNDQGRQCSDIRGITHDQRRPKQAREKVLPPHLEGSRTRTSSPSWPPCQNRPMT